MIPHYQESLQLSPHFSPNSVHECRGVLVHHSVMPYADTIAHMLAPHSQVSYHALIAPNGERCTLVPDKAVAWHAGVSIFRGRHHCNDFLLGLSFAGDTYQTPLSDHQLASALEWIIPRWHLYGWTFDWVTDHRQVAPGRKDDLAPREWERFQQFLRNHLA